MPAPPAPRRGGADLRARLLDVARRPRPAARRVGDAGGRDARSAGHPPLRPARRRRPAGHAGVVLGAVALFARRSPRLRALALGWAGHLAVDYLSHSTDAWPPLWPL